MDEVLRDAGSRLPGITAAIDVYDREDLFELLNNSDVCRLSHSGAGSGFSSEDAVWKSTGIQVRRILRAGLTATDAALELLLRVRQTTGRNASDFDLVLLCHSHSDAQGCRRLAGEIRAQMGSSAPVFITYNYGCSGFLRLLHEAVVQFESDPAISSILILNVETPEFWHDGSDRLFCGIVGAGATAVIVERGQGLPVSLARSEDFPIVRQEGVVPAPLFYRTSGAAVCFRGNPVHRTVMRMNAEPVFLNGIELMLCSLRSAVSSIEVAEGERVVVVPHQPSGKLLKALIAAARCEFPQFEFLNNLRRYGNTISASVPTILARLPEVLRENGLKPLRDGDHLILLAAGICMNDIGDSMSAGHACLRYQTIDSGRFPDQAVSQPSPAGDFVG